MLLSVTFHIKINNYFVPPASRLFPTGNFKNTPQWTTTFQVLFDLKKAFNFVLNSDQHQDMSCKTPGRGPGDTTASATPSTSSSRKYKGRALRSEDEKRRQTRERVRRLRERRERQRRGDNEVSSDEDRAVVHHRRDRSLLQCLDNATTEPAEENSGNKYKSPWWHLLPIFF